MKIIEPSNPILRQICNPVTNFNKNYQDLIDEISQLCMAKKAYAGAAPQFGIKERFIVIINPKEVKDPQEPITPIINSYFNPQIISMKGAQVYHESCISTHNTLSKVTRPYKIRVTYQDLLGKKHIKTFKGFETIVLCHEIDHLEGLLHTDRADIIYLNVSEEERKKIRENYPLVILNKTQNFLYEQTTPLKLNYQKRASH